MLLTMYQTEFKFFWPLTEQTELDLDYSDCEKPKYCWPDSGITTFSGIDGVAYTLGTNQPGWVSVSASKLQIDTETTVFFTKEEPPFYRKWLLKLLGIKWEVKN
jgi:hypothetical protein